MSGGVDSSTVAGMMKKEGYKVIGITLKLYDDGKEVAESKQCCSGQDIMDAKRVAHKLESNIKFCTSKINLNKELSILLIVI